jgi:hypothetical protein
MAAMILTISLGMERLSVFTVSPSCEAPGA